MKKERIEQGRFTEHSHGLGTVTDAMVWRRARQIAEINGRPHNQILDSDVAQARRELTGEERLVPEATAEEQLPESDRWKEVAESEGRKTPATPTPDEQTFAEELVEEGMEDAEQDQMLESVRRNRKEDRQT